MLKGRPLMTIFDLNAQDFGYREIARSTGHSRNTVRKYLRDGGNAKPSEPRPQRGSKLDPYKSEIDRLASEGLLSVPAIMSRIVPLGYAVYCKQTAALSATRPKSETPFRRDLFRSAVSLLSTVASIQNTTEVHTMRSNTTTTKAASRQSRGESVNQVQLIDRLVAAPDLRETPSGKHVTTVRVAVQAGSHPDFFDVVLWGQMADFATRYLTKGRLVYVAGRLS